MKENSGDELRKLSQKENEMHDYQRQICGLEEELDWHIQKVKAQQEELAGCYSDPYFEEQFDETESELREKEALRENIFQDIRQAIIANLDQIDNQRKQIMRNQKQEETS